VTLADHPPGSKPVTEQKAKDTGRKNKRKEGATVRHVPSDGKKVIYGTNIWCIFLNLLSFCVFKSRCCIFETFSSAQMYIVLTIEVNSYWTRFTTEFLEIACLILMI